MEAVSFLADIGIPTAGQCLALLAPLLALMGLRWLLANIDEAVRRLFPSQDWQRQLGWLNVQAERRAAAFLRWLGYLVYAALALALYGIVWGAEAFGQPGEWSDPMVLGNLTLRLPVLLTCLGLWLIYFGCELIPRLRRKEEREELEKFRAEMKKQEEKIPGSRLKPQVEIWTKAPEPRSKR